jgi:hypothetical protein
VTDDLAICPIVIRRTDVPDELATDTLVKPLGHVVLDEFLDQVAQMSLTKNHELVQSLALDGLDESFGVGIAIWASRWDFHALHAPRLVGSICRHFARSVTLLQAVYIS